MGGALGRQGGERVAYRVWAGNPEGKKPLGKPYCRQDKVKMDPKAVAWDDVDRVDLANDGDT